MIKSSEETDFPPREEGNSNEGKATTANKASSSSAPWLRLKDPRIVRVSRALGGKDRHSKVCTIRGLRDRRVRLSVPTAIQLYDLQDRLGLNQPSKVVDWLLNAAKHEIDELPPLLVPPGSFGLNHHQALSTPRQATASASQSNKEGFKSNESTNFWDTTSDSVWRARSKEIVRENEKENWRQRNLNEEDDRQGNDHNNGDQAGQVSPNNNVPPRTNINHTFFPPSMVHNSPLGYRWESQNYPLSHLGSHGFTSQAPHHHHLHNLNNAVSLPSTLSLSTGSTQFLVSPPGTTTQPYFPNSQGTSSMEIDPRQVNHFQMLSTSSNSQNPILPNSLYANNQTVRFPFHFSTTTSASKLVQYSQNNSGSQQNKERE